MPLDFLLDENISPVVADQVKRRCPDLTIESVHRWRDGAFKNRQDTQILIAAASEGLTLVTYDQKTIPNILDELFYDGQHHAGVIYVDERTIPGGDFGLLVRSLISFWKRFQSLDWIDRIQYLDKPEE
jgi:hypothetical protein